MSFRDYVTEYMNLRAEVAEYKRQGAALKKRVAEMERGIIRHMGNKGWRILILDDQSALEIKTEVPYRAKTEVEMAAELNALMKSRDRVEKVMSVVASKVPADKPKTSLSYVLPQASHVTMVLANAD